MKFDGTSWRLAAVCGGIDRPGRLCGGGGKADVARSRSLPARLPDGVA